MFREIIIAILGGNEESEKKQKYCRLCKAAKKDDCGNCEFKN